MRACVRACVRVSEFVVRVIISTHLVRSVSFLPAAECEGRHRSSLQEARDTLRLVERASESDLPRKTELMGTLYSLIGNSYFEMKDYNRALKYYTLDGNVAKDGSVKTEVANVLFRANMSMLSSVQMSDMLYFMLLFLYCFCS